jgi:hypothetical protein
MLYFMYMKYRPGWDKFSESYSSIHKWINNVHGKASRCEFETCTNVNATVFYYALKKGCRYERKRNNFYELCASCHKKYDLTQETRQKLSDINKGNTFARKGVLQLSLDGKIIEKYESMSIAAKANNILVSSISNAIFGRSKTAGNYIWQFA